MGFECASSRKQSSYDGGLYRLGPGRRPFATRVLRGCGDLRRFLLCDRVRRAHPTCVGTDINHNRGPKEDAKYLAYKKHHGVVLRF